MNKTFYITTPIYYPSNKLHIGNAYATVAADTMARYKRMLGFDVMFLTGTDDHGQKIERNAEAAGKTPLEFVDGIVTDIKKLWKLLNISNDDFLRTTEPRHIKAVQKIFKRLYEQGDIYKGEYEGLYCVPCEAFWTVTQAAGSVCPDCGRPVELAREESYFLRLSKYADRLLEHYTEHPEFIVPASRMNEMINNFIKPGLEDLAVSRTSFTWGIPVEFDPGHVVYVWLDALSNYVTALGYASDDDSKYKKYWPAEVHLVGKEIVRFHSIIWPIMLMALGEELPRQIFGHGWLLGVSGDKMSKSKGNVVDPVILCGRYGVDAIRYFLMREMPLGSDSVFSNEILINRINSDLANDLGNLLSRTTAMLEKYFDGKTPENRTGGGNDAELLALITATVGKYEEYMDGFQFSAALTEVWRLIGRANKYIDETAPWLLAKDEANFPRLGAVLYNLCEALRAAALLISPVMPDTSAEIFRQLGVTDAKLTEWGQMKAGLRAGCYKICRGEAMFPRLDLKKEMEALHSEAAPELAPEAAPVSAPSGPEPTQISIDDFAKVELRVVQITGCEPVEKSNKLLKLQVDAGTEKRQVVSGIAEWYGASDLVGRKVLLVANLKPAKLRGVLSEGMILAADNPDGSARVIFADDDAEVGSKVR